MEFGEPTKFYLDVIVKKVNAVSFNLWKLWLVGFYQVSLVKFAQLQLSNHTAYQLNLFNLFEALYDFWKPDI